MAEWWSILTLELKIFYCISITASFMLVAQLILMLLGADDGDADLGDVGDVGDIDGLGEHPGDLHLLSLRTIVAFFLGFGWTGVICLKRGMTVIPTLGIALVVGALFMGVVFYLMRALYGLRESGNIDYRNAVGKIGSVYAPIPPKQSGPGQVEIMIQGRVRFVQAFTKADQRIPGSTRVKVVDLFDPRTLLVEPLETHPSETKEE